MTIEILTGFDGSCPHSKRGVKKDKRGRYTLYPGTRKVRGISEEAAGCGSRLSTRILNSGKRTVTTTLAVDWHTEKRVLNHDIGYIRHESKDEWTMIPGIVKGAVVRYKLKLKPGVTHLGLYPEYNYSQYCAFIDALEKDGIKVETIGKSREKRQI